MFNHSFGNRQFVNRKNFSPHRGGRPRFRRDVRGNRQNFGQRRVRTFDPSHLVGKEIAQNTEAFVPKHNFSDFPISDLLRQNIASHGYNAPTPIQDQAIPEALAGRDIIGVAKTGTGKTAAFLLPLINKVFNDRGQKVLIVTPTRELAVQIEDEFNQFARNMNLYSVLCIGGVGLGKQIYGLRRNANFVIGTPGRLIDLESRHAINFSHYGNVVLDEVDRILDMGFIRDLRQILSQLPVERQSFFFSATMQKEVEVVARGFLRDPVLISVQSNEPAANVDQEVIRINGKPKVDVLHDLLNNQEFKKVLVFGRTKWGIQKLSIELQNRGFKVEAIHGNKSQGQRQRALDNFKNDYSQVLLATDIVARGLDINDVTHVINYDLPETYEAYIHRIGRTGRIDKKGKAITLVG